MMRSHPLFFFKTMGNAWGSALGWMMSHNLRVYRSELEAVVVDVCYRQPDQEKAAKAFLRQELNCTAKKSIN